MRYRHLILTSALLLTATYFLPPMSRYLLSAHQTILRRTNRLMSSLAPQAISPSDPSIQRILSFWFEQPDPINRWFRPDPAFDSVCAKSFGSLVTQARLPNSPLHEPWTATPDGTLALLILLDQFPRNIFRGSGEAFASDAKARDVALAAIVKGFDRQVVGLRQSFFYLPLEHGEDLLCQVASVSLCEGSLNRAKERGDEFEVYYYTEGLKAAEKHRDVIVRFGRYPGRNKALGRESTAEEEEFLKEHPFGI